MIEAYQVPDRRRTSDWLDTNSKDYAGYGMMGRELRAETLETQIASGSAWIGTPAEVREAIAARLADGPRPNTPRSR